MNLFLGGSPLLWRLTSSLEAHVRNLLLGGSRNLCLGGAYTKTLIWDPHTRNLLLGNSYKESLPERRIERASYKGISYFEIHVNVNLPMRFHTCVSE